MSVVPVMDNTIQFSKPSSSLGSALVFAAVWTPVLTSSCATRQAGEASSGEQDWANQPLKPDARISLFRTLVDDPLSSDLLLTLDVHGSVQVSDWLVAETGKDFITQIEADDAEQLIRKCADGVFLMGKDRDEGVLVFDAPSYRLVFFNDGESHETCFPEVDFGRVRLGLPTSSDSCWAERIVWNAMIAEIAGNTIGSPVGTGGK